MDSEPLEVKTGADDGGTAETDTRADIKEPSPFGTITVPPSANPIQAGESISRGIDFKAKLIGYSDIPAGRGDQICQWAMQQLKAKWEQARKQTNQHKPRIFINVSLDGLKIVEQVQRITEHSHAVETVSFVYPDPTDARAFGYVFSPDASTHKFFAVKTEGKAELVIDKIKEMFRAVVELRNQAAKKVQKDEAEKTNKLNEKIETVNETVPPPRQQEGRKAEQDKDVPKSEAVAPPQPSLEKATGETKTSSAVVVKKDEPTLIEFDSAFGQMQEKLKGMSVETAFDVILKGEDQASPQPQTESKEDPWGLSSVNLAPATQTPAVQHTQATVHAQPQVTGWPQPQPVIGAPFASPQLHQPVTDPFTVDPFFQQPSQTSPRPPFAPQQPVGTATTNPFQLMEPERPVEAKQETKTVVDPFADIPVGLPTSNKRKEQFFVEEKKRPSMNDMVDPQQTKPAAEVNPFT